MVRLHGESLPRKRLVMLPIVLIILRGDSGPTKRRFILLMLLLLHGDSSPRKRNCMCLRILNNHRLACHGKSRPTKGLVLLLLLHGETLCCLRLQVSISLQISS